MSSAATGTAPLGRPARLRRLGRVLLIALAFGAGVGLVLLLAGIGVYWYSNRPVPVKDWPALHMPGLGVTASLKTRWSDGSLKYQFGVSPEQGLEKAFAQVAHNKSNRFVVHLSDRDGFELCDFEPKLTVTVGDSGEPKMLDSNGYSTNCDRSHVRNASTWNLSWVFPKLSDVKPQEAGGVTGNIRDLRPLPAAGDIDMTGAVLYEDTLTGIDVFGHLETKSGHSFVITREAEKHSAYISWQTRASLRYSCKRRNDCVLENLDNGETVHVRLVR